MSELAIIVAVGLGTYAMRAVFLTVGSDWNLGVGVHRRLHLAKHAVLAGLTVGFVSSGHVAPTVSAAGLVSAGATALVVRDRPLAPLAVGVGVALLAAFI